MGFDVAKISFGFAAGIVPTWLMGEVTRFGAIFARNYQVEWSAKEGSGLVFTAVVHQMIKSVQEYVSSNKESFFYSQNNEFVKGFSAASSVFTAISISNLFKEKAQEGEEEDLKACIPGVLTALFLSYQYGDNPLIPVAGSAAISALYTLFYDTKMKQRPLIQ